ncbi:MAG: RloB family protein [Candidatus Eremiobacteraeota bacterium]|nr:RloB family protein [Candidatus Eremiobacteraeota bacterium]
MSKRYNRDNRSYKRRVKFREQRNRFLIVCQGTETEKNYFNGFKIKLKKNNIEIICEPVAPDQVVNTAIKRRKNAKKERYNQVWCVFDKDDLTFTDECFNSAIRTAQSEGIGVAYSNESFELWFYLHFCYCDSPLSRSVLFKKVKEKFDENFRREYEKNDKKILKLLEDKIETAIRHSSKLYSQYDHKNPAKDNPSTTVHLLVEKLRGLE